MQHIVFAEFHTVYLSRWCFIALRKDSGSAGSNGTYMILWRMATIVAARRIQSFQTFQSLRSFRQTFIDIVTPQSVAASEIFVIVSVKNVIENSDRTRPRNTNTNGNESYARPRSTLRSC